MVTAPNSTSMRQYANLPDVNVGDAETLFEPDTGTEGYWVGAPCIHAHGNTTYLAVRYRTPDVRGHRVSIYERRAPAESFEHCTDVTADDLGVVSIERASLATDPDTGDLELYLPVDHGENDWTIQKLADAPTPEAFDPATAHDVLRPEPGTTDAATVKDPFVLTVGGRYYMFYAGHDGHSEQAHLATSVDGENWTRADANPLVGRQYWHDHHTRISTVIPAPDAPAWLVFYEGSGRTDYGNTWNLRTGLAVSHDLRSAVDTSPHGPWLSAPTADARTGVSTFATCRYLDVLERDGAWELFFEVARDDGAFELRTTTVEP